MSHLAPAPPGERLARVEARLEQLVETAARAHADLREHLVWQQRVYEAQERRFVALELSAEQTRTHLRWMKGVGIAVQGAVLAWLGLK